MFQVLSTRLFPAARLLLFSSVYSFHECILETRHNEQILSKENKYDNKSYTTPTTPPLPHPTRDGAVGWELGRRVRGVYVWCAKLGGRGVCVRIDFVGRNSRLCLVPVLHLSARHARRCGGAGRRLILTTSPAYAYAAARTGQSTRANRPVRLTTDASSGSMTRRATHPSRHGSSGTRLHSAGARGTRRCSADDADADARARVDVEY